MGSRRCRRHTRTREGQSDRWTAEVELERREREQEAEGGWEGSE